MKIILVSLSVLLITNIYSVEKINSGEILFNEISTCTLEGKAMIRWGFSILKKNDISALNYSKSEEDIQYVANFGSIVKQLSELIPDPPRTYYSTSPLYKIDYEVWMKWWEVNEKYYLDDAKLPPPSETSLHRIHPQKRKEIEIENIARGMNAMTNNSYDPELAKRDAAAALLVQKQEKQKIWRNKFYAISKPLLWISAVLVLTLIVWFRIKKQKNA